MALILYSVYNYVYELLNFETPKNARPYAIMWVHKANEEKTGNAGYDVRTAYEGLKYL